MAGPGACGRSEAPSAQFWNSGSVMEVQLCLRLLSREASRRMWDASWLFKGQGSCPEARLCELEGNATWRGGLLQSGS